MKLTVVLAVLIGTFALACSSNASTPVKSTSNNGATIESRDTELTSNQQPSNSSTAKSDDELEIYFEQMVTTNEEFVKVMQTLADSQDSAYSQMQKMVSSTQVTPSDLENWYLAQQAALEEAYIGLRDIPGRWVAITAPDDLADFHNLMLQVIRIKLEVVQKWKAGANSLLLDSNQAAKLMAEGDRLDDEADDLYFQAMSEGKRKGLPLGQ
jgi:hypothetical protein